MGQSGGGFTWALDGEYITGVGQCSTQRCPEGFWGPLAAIPHTAPRAPRCSPY